MTRTGKYLAASALALVAWVAGYRGSAAQSLPAVPSVAYSGYLEGFGSTDRRYTQRGSKQRRRSQPPAGERARSVFSFR